MCLHLGCRLLFKAVECAKRKRKGLRKSRKYKRCTSELIGVQKFESLTSHKTPALHGWGFYFKRRSLADNNVTRYYLHMICSFANSTSEKVWLRERVKTLPPDVQKIAHRKLLMIDAADYVRDLWVPPGNRLEALTGNRKGQHSIRVNDQWRICFTWTQLGAENIEIVDYH